MKAVILAAGVGSRLSPATGGAPKCLVDIGGDHLLSRHVAALEACGVTDLIVIVGHRASEIESALTGVQATFVFNEDYRTTNSLFSLSLAAPMVSGTFLVVNADVLAHPEIYSRVAGAEGTALAFDPTSGDDAEHMKVAVESGRVAAMSKQLPGDRVAGENVGILKIHARDRETFFSGAEALLLGPARQTAWAPAAMDRLCKVAPVEPVDIADLPWVEIDFPLDLDHARRVTWPDISGGVARRAAR